MAQQLVTDIILNLSGNLAQKANQYGANMSKFAKRNQRAMGIIKKSTEAAGRGFDKMSNRYVAAAASIATVSSARTFATLDRRLSRVAIAADITREAASELYSEIQKVSNQEGIRIAPEEALSAIEEILTKTGDLDYAINNLPSIAAVIQATGAGGLQVGGIFTEFKKLAIDSSESAMAAIDILNKQGKSGAFTLANMASLGPQIFAAYAATGRQGKEAVTELGAALQVIRQGVGSDATAVTAFEALIRDITNPERVKKLQQLGGINVFDPEKLKAGVEIMRPLPELMEEIVLRSQGLSRNLDLLNLTDEAKRALNPLIAEFSQTGDIKAFDPLMQITGDGSVTLQDAKVAADDFAASLQLINNAWNQFATRELAEPIAELAAAINSLEPEAVQDWLDTGKNIAIVVGGLVAARKALGVASDLKNIFGNGSKPSTGGKGGFSDLGAMPVYVVNMPGGGMGGMTDPIVPDGKGGGGSKASKALKYAKGATIAIASASIVVGGVYSASQLAQDMSPVDFRRRSTVDTDGLPEAFPVAPGLLDVLDEIKSWFSSTPNAVESKSSLDIKVSDDRVRVTNVNSAPGLSVNIDTGRSMTAN